MSSPRATPATGVGSLARNAKMLWRRQGPQPPPQALVHALGSLLPRLLQDGSYSQIEICEEARRPGAAVLNETIRRRRRHSTHVCGLQDPGHAKDLVLESARIGDGRKSALSVLDRGGASNHAHAAGCRERGCRRPSRRGPAATGELAGSVAWNRQSSRSHKDESSPGERIAEYTKGPRLSSGLDTPNAM